MGRIGVDRGQAKFIRVPVRPEVMKVSTQDIAERQAKSLAFDCCLGIRAADDRDLLEGISAEIVRPNERPIIA